MNLENEKEIEEIARIRRLMNGKEGRKASSEVKLACGMSGTFAEGGSRSRLNAEMQRRDSRFDTSLYSFESASGVETIFETGVRVGASEKAKRASEELSVIGSIVDCSSEGSKEDIMRWESD
jgi:hypothetical protein